MTHPFFFPGGCGGGEDAPPEYVPQWSPDVVSGLRHEPFIRERYGARTTSFLIGCGDSHIVIDQGSGIKHVGKILLEKLRGDGTVTALIDVLMTHYHRDHIVGILQNPLLFPPSLRLRFFSPDLSRYNPPPPDGQPQSVERLINAYFTRERGISPIPMAELLAGREYVNFKPDQNDILVVGQQSNIRVETMPLNHKEGCCGYRIFLPGYGPVVILTDHEPGLEADPKIVDWLNGATLAVLDMQYSDAQYNGEAPTGSYKRERGGFGHGTPLRWFPNLLACKNPPKRVLITHHDPNHTDDYLDRFWEESLALLIRMYGRSLPFDYQFARGGQLYWL
jgi:glyoxylase-like metal-dependent hydrolase (beta-lactamase superfamily II)